MYKHPLICEVETIESIRMYSLLEIAAMKVQGILGRGKKKDFFGIQELLTIFSLEQIIDAHKKKFPSQQLAISIPNALSFFEDANQDQDTISLKGQSWESVQTDIRKAIRQYLI